MIGHMIVQNVLHRPLRTLITVIAVAVEVALVISVVGLTSGLLSDVAKRTEGVGADIMVQPPSASVWISFTNAPMPISIGSKLRQLDYIESVAPVLLQFTPTASKSFTASSRKASARFRAVSFSMRDTTSRARTTSLWTTYTPAQNMCSRGRRSTC